MGCEFMESISRNILTMFINDNVLTIVKLKVLIAEWVKFKKNSGKLLSWPEISKSLNFVDKTIHHFKYHQKRHSISS